jgi:hypothetical protein
MRKTFQAMKTRDLLKKLGLAAVGGLLLFAAAAPAMAQGCALCYTQAAASGSRMIQALRSGILILIVPPTFMSVAMVVIMYRKRHQIRLPGDADCNVVQNPSPLHSSATPPWNPPA